MVGRPLVLLFAWRNQFLVRRWLWLGLRRSVCKDKWF
ncbi:unnamed protein product [Arabidopsis halleri]